LLSFGFQKTCTPHHQKGGDRSGVTRRRGKPTKSGTCGVELLSEGVGQAKRRQRWLHLVSTLKGWVHRLENSIELRNRKRSQGMIWEFEGRNTQILARLNGFIGHLEGTAILQQS